MTQDMVRCMYKCLLENKYFPSAIPFQPFVNMAASMEPKYSIGYIYEGNPAKQIEYAARTNNLIKAVSPSYFNINADGSLSANSINTEVINYMHNNNIKVVPFLSNHWNRNAGINALNNAQKLAEQIADYVDRYNLDGVNVDIENVTEAQRNQYTELLRVLREKIPKDKEVSVAVSANPGGLETGWHGSYDYTGLSQNADYLMVMAYDEHYEGGTPGPVASIEFVENSIRYALSKAPKNKIVLGIPLYGRIWSVDNSSVVGRGVGIDIINKMIKDYNGVVTFDETAGVPKAEFEIKSGDKEYTVGERVLQPGKYVVWYEDEKSIKAKLNLITKYDLKGAGFWALGLEDPVIWETYKEWLNNKDV